MSYDIDIYKREFLSRAIAENLHDWTDADPIRETVLTYIRDRLFSMSYILETESELCQEYIHPNSSWGLQVSVFSNMVSFSIPSGDDAANAIETARTDALNLAMEYGLGYHDPQTGEVHV